MGKCLLLKTGTSGVNPDELTAETPQVLSGYLAGVKGCDEPTAGSMPNNGAISGTLNCGQSKSIPKGYTTGGTVTANSLASQTPATVTASQILTGQTAWVNGNKVTGSMQNRGTVNQSLGINGSYTIPAGYHNGSGKITQSVATQGGSTTTPGTSNKTIVAANRYVTGNIIVAGSSNLTAGNIKKGVNIFGVTGTWEGYVATPNDLYKYGINNGQFIDVSPTGGYGHTSFESNQVNMYLRVSKGPSHLAAIVSSIPHNLSGYNKLTMTFHVYSANKLADTSASNFVRLGIAKAQGSRVLDLYSEFGAAALQTTGTKTLTFNVSAINAAKYICINLSAQMLGTGQNYVGIYIYQITLS